MTSYLAFPPALRVEGTVRVPGSKSATNRALLLAAISERPVTIAGPLESDDTRALTRCLQAMGARFTQVAGGVSVTGPLGSTSRPGSPVILDAEDSGTAARFLAAIASAVPGEYLLTGSARLSERPMDELVAALRSLGADLREEGAPGRLPLTIRGGSLSAGSVRVDASRSSQFLSALLLAGAARSGGAALEIAAAPAEGARGADSEDSEDSEDGEDGQDGQDGLDGEKRLTGPIASAPYVRVTVDALRAFGHTVAGEGSGPWRVSRGESSPERYEVPGDFSSAIPLLAAAGACGGEVRLRGLAWPSPDADALALPVLSAMGLEISATAEEISARAARGGLRPIAIAATEYPDAVPALAALASLAPGESRFEGIAHLRWKESDRLEALATVLSAAGAQVSSREDGLQVSGAAGLGVSGAAGRASAGGIVRLPTFRDHRIAMAAGILSLARPGLLIEDPDCVSKSYPAFFRDLDGLCRR